MNFFSIPFFLADQPPPNAGASSIIMMALFFMAFWFLLIAPQRKKQKAQEQMIAALKEGDEIITTSGLFASILQVKKDRLLIKTGDAKLELHKNFVQTRLNATKVDSNKLAPQPKEAK
jgi:preprotein translocase subunit YajC